MGTAKMVEKALDFDGILIPIILMYKKNSQITSFIRKLKDFSQWMLRIE